MSKFNPNTLKPGDAVRTDRGQATFIQSKTGNWNNQNHQVRLRNGETRWYTAQQLEQYNGETTV